MSKYEIIWDVYQTHSISKTAARLNYTNSAVSQAIRSFEKDLNVTLFNRSNNGMEPVSGMEDIFAEIKKICSSGRRIEQIADSFNSLESGFIRIGTIQSVSYHWLPFILKSFSAEYPNITFQVYVEGFQKLTQLMDQGDLDCIFISKYAAGNRPFLPIGHDELALVTAIDHPLSEKLTVSFSDVNGQDFILSADGLDYETGNVFRMNNIQPRIRYHVNEDYSVIKMVEQGFGITVLPRLLLNNIPFNVCVRSFTEHYKRVLGIAYPSRTDISPALSKLLLSAELWSKEKGLL